MEYNIQKPLVSILIPTFNREDVIERALKSALNQTYDNYEIVIVDDGSTDNTKKLLEPYLSEKVRLIEHSENRGITSARNTLLDNARGEWIAFLSSDDELYPEAIETIMQKTLEFPDVNWFCAHMIDFSSGDYACGDDCHGHMPPGVFPSSAKNCSEAWYMTKLATIGEYRFVEGLNTFESEWLFRILPRLSRFFVNMPLYIYHTEYEQRVTKSYENGTSPVIMEEQWVRLMRQSPNYAADRYKNGLGNVFPYVIGLLESAGENALAEKQKDIAIELGLEYAVSQNSTSFGSIKVSISERIKQVVVRVLRKLKLKPPQPPEEL